MRSGGEDVVDNMAFSREQLHHQKSQAKAEIVKVRKTPPLVVKRVLWLVHSGCALPHILTAPASAPCVALSIWRVDRGRTGPDLRPARCMSERPCALPHGDPAPFAPWSVHDRQLALRGHPMIIRNNSSHQRAPSALDQTDEQPAGAAR